MFGREKNMALKITTDLLIIGEQFIMWNKFAEFHFGFSSGREIRSFRAQLSSDDDVVDRDVDQLDEEADEAHDGETDGRGNRDLLELWKQRREKKWGHC